MPEVVTTPVAVNDRCRAARRAGGRPRSGLREVRSGRRTWPSCASATARTMARPRPPPSGLAELPRLLRSKIESTSLVGTPGPSSATDSTSTPFVAVAPSSMEASSPACLTALATSCMTPPVAVEAVLHRVLVDEPDGGPAPAEADARPVRQETALDKARTRCGDPGTPNPSQVPLCHEVFPAVAPLEHLDACSALHDLKATCRRIEQEPIDQDRPTFPGAVRLPTLCDANVDSVPAGADPVVWVGGILVNAIAIRGTCRYRDELLERDHLHLPPNR